MATNKYLNEGISSSNGNSHNTSSLRHVFTTGRSVWYDNSSGQPREPFIIGVCGGTASGKTSVCAYPLLNFFHFFLFFFFPSF